MIRRSSLARVGIASVMTIASLASLRLMTACTQGSAATPTNLALPPTQPLVDAGRTADAACTQLEMPNGAVVHVTGTVVASVAADASAATPVPIANAMIAVEYGGLYLSWCDLGNASPYYVFGALSDDAGRFEIDVKEGALGFHSFADDYYYSRAPLDSRVEKTVALEMEPLPKMQAQPTIANAAFDKTTVSPGELVTYSAMLKTWSGTDPLSDENVLVNAAQSWGIELNPPAIGEPDNFADGLWKRTFAAPSDPGTYTYWFSATTSQCVTSKLTSATLTVRAP